MYTIIKIDPGITILEQCKLGKVSTKIQVSQLYALSLYASHTCIVSEIIVDWLSYKILPVTMWERAWCSIWMQDEPIFWWCFCTITFEKMDIKMSYFTCLPVLAPANIIFGYIFCDKKRSNAYGLVIAQLHLYDVFCCKWYSDILYHIKFKTPVLSY